jgi:hypothetical protein
MFTATKAARTSTTRRNAPGLTADPYRPELHYMRGRGPKWHAKHDQAPIAARAVLVPALARVRAQR